VKARLLVGRGREPRREAIEDLIVETQEQGLQLAHDLVLVVALIADQRRVVVGAEPIRSDLACDTDVLRTETELPAAHGLVIKIGLVVRAAAVQAVQIQPWGTKVLERTRIILLLQR